MCFSLLHHCVPPKPWPCSLCHLKKDWYDFLIQYKTLWVVLNHLLHFMNLLQFNSHISQKKRTGIALALLPIPFMIWISLRMIKYRFDTHTSIYGGGTVLVEVIVKLSANLCSEWSKGNFKLSNLISVFTLRYFRTGMCCWQPFNILLQSVGWRRELGMAFHLT